MNNILSESLTPVEEICEKERLELINNILNSLDSRERKVLEDRLFNKLTWDKIAINFPRQIPRNKYDRIWINGHERKMTKKDLTIGVSRERVRQTFRKAIFRFIHKALKHKLIEGNFINGYEVIQKYFPESFCLTGELT